MTLKLIEANVKSTPKGFTFWIDGSAYFFNPRERRLFLIQLDEIDLTEHKPVPIRDEGEWVTDEMLEEESRREDSNE